MICICESLSHIGQNTKSTKPKPSTPSSPPISGLPSHFRSDNESEAEISKAEMGNIFNSAKSTKVLSFSQIVIIDYFNMLTRG